MFGRKKKSNSNSTIESALSHLAQAGSDHPNAEAYKWLDEAMYTSSKIKGDERESDIVEYDNIFPTNAEQAEKMRQCVDKAQEVAGDPNDQFLNTRVETLNKVINWSTQRHSTFQWVLIVGVVITLIIFNFMRGSQEEDVARAQAKLEIVKNWTAQDTTVNYATLSFVKMKYDDRFVRANNYKLEKLSGIKDRADYCSKNAVTHRQQADTTKSADDKKSYLEYAQKEEKEAKEKRELFDEINNMKFKEFHELAIGEMERRVDNEQSSSNGLLRWFIFFAILIPLYIISQRPYGYTITRLKTESAIVGGIQKIFVGMGAGLALGGLAMQYVPTTYITKWSDGSTTKEKGSTADFASHLTIQLIFIAVGVFIFCFTSSLLMIYLTFQGLRRNYNWSNIAAKAQSYTKKDDEQKTE